MEEKLEGRRKIYTDAARSAVLPVHSLPTAAAAEVPCRVECRRRPSTDQCIGSTEIIGVRVNVRFSRVAAAAYVGSSVFSSSIDVNLCAAEY